MGMFDAKLYLTGDEGIVKVGDEFILHHAEIMPDKINVDGKLIDEVGLDIELPDGDELRVYTGGRAIANQVKRKDARDMFPVKVKLIEKSAGKGKNKMRLLERVEDA